MAIVGVASCVDVTVTVVVVNDRFAAETTVGTASTPGALVRL